MIVLVHLETPNQFFYFRVEKYRPSTLEDLISHEDIIRTINHFIKEDQLPHLLFYGPPGTGKTSTILACAKQLYSPNQFSSMVGTTIVV
ncbi:Replication factor C (RF-C) subunit [Homalodisca vitripennis]|nr:Replication factor C (RF-C) subunit [Homalodisca vitripennis]